MDKDWRFWKNQRLLDRRQFWLFGHLLIVHALIFGGGQSLPLRLLWPLAVGLFLLWQPFVAGEKRVAPGVAVVFLLLVLASSFWLTPWWLLLWTTAMAALIAGRLLRSGERFERLAYLMAFTCLLGGIVFGVVPGFAPTVISIAPLSPFWLALGLPLLLPALLFCSPRRGDVSGEVFDFLHVLLVFLLLTTLVLGSLAVMQVGRRPYLESVFLTILALAGGLLFLAWLWNPRAGFAGLGVVLSKYVLELGMPLEQWLGILRSFAREEGDSFSFLGRALPQLADLPGVSGVIWECGDGRSGRWDDQRRRAGMHRHDFSQEGLHLALLLNYSPSPAMCRHFDSLLQLAAEFYCLKQQHEARERMEYLRAIYETGARVTHDVKNLLQSMQTLCYAAAQPGDETGLRSLLGRQLPAIAERLQATLTRLERPSCRSARVPVQAWYAALRLRYASQPVSWQVADFSAGAADVPGDLFDSVAENLLQNALQKRQQEMALTIRFRLAPSVAGWEMSVTDNGSAALRTDLLCREPVPSALGFGTGLYHAAQMAREYGYQLSLVENRAGAVCFRLFPLAVP